MAGMYVPGSSSDNENYLYIYYTHEIKSHLTMFRYKYDFILSQKVQFVKDKEHKYSKDPAYILIQIEVDLAKYTMFKLSGQSIETDIHKSVRGSYTLVVEVKEKTC
jgi:hypothetical protein